MSQAPAMQREQFWDVGAIVVVVFLSHHLGVVMRLYKPLSLHSKSEMQVDPSQ
jgi:hypothetical protein